jgi:hypothetical protein
MNLRKLRSSLSAYLLLEKGYGIEPEIGSDKTQMAACIIWEGWIIKSKFEAIEWNYKK